MELIERDDFLALMQEKFNETKSGEGHCFIVSGEAGIGKTSLIRTFSSKNDHIAKIYSGACDALFTPRPLAPVYDIAFQISNDDWELQDRNTLFAKILQSLQQQTKLSLVLIEDIHWADEATLDFIRYFIRRITRMRCLLVITYRDSEILSGHPFRTILGQLPRDFFTRIALTPLSKQAVEILATTKGYKGEDVYSISGGNPFYVTEILANYSPGIPVNIKDSILSVYNRQDEKTKQVWQLLSAAPNGMEVRLLEQLEPEYISAIHQCIDSKILVMNGEQLSFKHELYRRTIETSLSPLIRKEINKRILQLLIDNYDRKPENERIIHHAKNAHDPSAIVTYGPVAAQQASAMGAHVESAKFYLTIIEFFQQDDPLALLQFYEPYAYECYLTNQIKEAIIYVSKSLKILKERNDIEKSGNCLRFLSRLWWYEGDGKKALAYATESIELLNSQPPSRTKAMAFSNMSQLKMLSDDRDECIRWGEQAIDMAKSLGDEETLSHALNNVSTVYMRNHSTRKKGISLMQQSLEIALANSYQEHAARAYTNLGSNTVKMKDYVFGSDVLSKGIQYCEERDLDSFLVYLLQDKARLSLETGKWKEALAIEERLMENEAHPPVAKIGTLVVMAVIKMRRGDEGVLSLLQEAKEKAFATKEQQRIIPVMTAFLEYEWITGQSYISKDELELAIKINSSFGNIYEKGEFAYWLFKSRKQQLPITEYFEGYNHNGERSSSQLAESWKEIGCPYETALALFNGNELEKRQAMEIVFKLGAMAIHEKMKFDMRASGIKSIPRGLRKSTQTNPANLTERELAVLRLLKDGLRNKEIAGKLFISAKTVDHHLSQIFFKLSVNTRAKAIQEADRMNIV